MRRPPARSAFSEGEADQSGLTSSDTFFDIGAAPARSAAELRVALGNSNSRLKPRASILPPQSLRKTASTGDLGTVFPSVALEKAKSRARIEVDIVLESDTCVQGSYLKGLVKIHVRKCLKKDSPLLLARGKIRVVGFECIPLEDNRCTFYQRSALLSEVTTCSQDLYKGAPDQDGWAEAKEGIHVMPFAMLLPVDGSCGTPKGILNIHSGVSVRYVAMASIKVRDPKTSKESVAHFYRDCEIWPRLEVALSLAPAPRPLSGEVCKGVFMGGSGKVKFTARLHRLHWVAGQRCTVQLRVVNETKKTIKGATIALIRTTTVFRPHPHLAAGNGSRIADPDACQTSTMRKQVSEATLEMGQRCAKGHASAKGWWTGVAPGQTSEFSHHILLPADALSVARVRLLEVEYTLRVSVTAGSMGSDVHVILPIRIVNFVSLDPPHSSPL
ncbi:E set domain-containing protein, partial [Leucogyrophana mollusca]